MMTSRVMMARTSTASASRHQTWIKTRGQWLT